MTRARPSRPDRPRGRRGPRWVSLPVALAVALVAAVAGPVAVALSLTPQLRSQVPAPGPAPGHRGGPPPFFVDTSVLPRGTGPVQVRASATGSRVAQDQRAVNTSAIASLGAGRGFVAAGPVSSSCRTRLYRLRLSASGRPGSLSPLPVPELHGRVLSLAGSADGQVIGYAIRGCPGAQPDYVGVIRLRGGHSRQWGAAGPGRPGHVAMVLKSSLSLSADGRLLAFTGWDAAPDGSLRQQVVRVLPASAPPGPLASRSRIVRRGQVAGPDLAAAAVSPGGGTLYLCTVASSATGYTETISGYRTATGRGGALLASFVVRGRARPGNPPCPLALARSGRYLLVQYSLRPAATPSGQQVVAIARIAIGSRAVSVITISGPGPGQLAGAKGVRVAW